MADLCVAADVPPSVRRLVEERGHDVAIPQDLGQRAAPDAEPLVTATQRGPILITDNGNEVRMLCQARPYQRRIWGRQPTEHVGPIAIPQHPLRPHPQPARHIDRMLDQPSSGWNDAWFFDPRIGEVRPSGSTNRAKTGLASTGFPTRRRERRRGRRLPASVRAPRPTGTAGPRLAAER